MKFNKRVDRIKVEKKCYNEALKQTEQQIKDRIIELVDYYDELDIEMRALQDALYSKQHPVNKKRKS